MTGFDFTPIVVLGAGRSGTNMLRDALTALEGFETWPCDEINPIWRHGNIRWPNDEFPPERAARSRDYIRGAFQRIWRDTGKPAFVVEKTCANTLRVPFVDAVVPEAKYIHIIRDGVDVVASAQKRWKGEMELASVPYYLAKIKYAPLMDLPRYGFSFLRNRIQMLRSNEKRMDVWGPRFSGMDEAQNASLGEICARQWVACVDQASEALAQLPPDRHTTVSYEAFTERPVEALREITDFLGLQIEEQAIVAAVAVVSQRSVGKGRKALSGNVEHLMDILRPALQRYGYEG